MLINSSFVRHVESAALRYHHKEASKPLGIELLKLNICHTDLSFV